VHVARGDRHRSARHRLRSRVDRRTDDRAPTRCALGRRLLARTRGFGVRSVWIAAGSRSGLADLVAGDTLVVWRLDRLGRSLRDLLDNAELLRKRDVTLRSLTDQLDTSTAAGRMLYAVLGAVAQFERDVLRERTTAGLSAARRRGERLGRRPALTPAQVAQARKMVDGGDSVRHMARTCESVAKPCSVISSERRRFVRPMTTNKPLSSIVIDQSDGAGARSQIESHVEYMIAIGAFRASHPVLVWHLGPLNGLNRLRSIVGRNESHSRFCGMNMLTHSASRTGPRGTT